MSVNECAVKSKANLYATLIVAFIGGMLVMVGISSVLTIGQYWSGLTLSDLDNTKIPARGETTFTWDVEGIGDFEAKLYIAGIDGDDEEKLDKDLYKVVEHSDELSQIKLTLNNVGYDEEFMIKCKVTETESERVIEDTFLVETYDSFWAEIDGEFGDDEWQTVDEHAQYTVPYNISAIVGALFGLNDLDGIFDIEDVATKDYTYLNVHYTKDDGLYILYDWCFGIANELDFEGFGLFIDTDGDQETLLDLTTIIGPLLDEMDNGLEFIIYNSSDQADSVNFTKFGLPISINSTLEYEIARGFGPTVHSSVDHVFFEIHVESDELKTGATYMNEDAFGIGGIGVYHLDNGDIPILPPIMIVMTPTLTLPIAEATFFDCGFGNPDLVWRP